MTSMQSDAGYADRVLQAAMVAVTGGLDADRVAEVVAKVVEAIDKQAATLKAATYRPEDYERIARAMAHAMKSADGALPARGVCLGAPGQPAR
jgi:2-keto-3-deoxy-6-phosphogluconate aldolase